MAHHKLNSPLPLYDPSEQMLAQASKSGPLTSVTALLHPRKARLRASFFAAFALISVSAYIIFFASPTLSLSPFALRGSESLHSLLAADPNAPIRKSRPSQPPPAPLQLDQAQELAAVSSFLASLPQNVIPSSIDPTKPIDPHVVLDFDTRSPRAAEEVQSMVNDVWLRNPVMLYCKHWSPVSREVTSVLSRMNINPPPTIFEVDLRDDAEVLEPLIARLTNSELPVLLVGGKSIGPMSDIRTLDESGQLQAAIAAAGAVVEREKPKGRRLFPVRS